MKSKKIRQNCYMILIFLIALMAISCAPPEEGPESKEKEFKVYANTYYESYLVKYTKECDTISKVKIQYFFDNTEQDLLNEAIIENKGEMCKITKEGRECLLPMIHAVNVTNIDEFSDQFNLCQN